LHQLVEELNLQDIVSFHPPVPQRALPNWYRRCTVHVNLTPTGFGDKVAWEAMACAKPCLVANEGFRETLGEYSNILFFRYNDSIDLASKLSLILDLPFPEQKCIGQYLRERVVQIHSLDKLVMRLTNVFSMIRGESRCY
jgi:glycosyltransferase involved in cell wall biosynthesis